MPPALVTVAHWTVRVAGALALAEVVAFHGVVWAIADSVTAPEATLGAAGIAGAVGLANTILGARNRKDGKDRGDALIRIEQKVDDARTEAATTRGRVDSATEALRAELHELRTEVREGFAAVRRDDRIRDDRITALETQARREAQP